MDLLKLLYNMPKNSIYALINEQDKEIFLTYSTNSLSSLTRLINEIKAGYGLSIDLSKFQYKLLEEIKNQQILAFRFNYWYDYFKNDGYKLYNKRKPVNYKLNYTVGQDFRNKANRLLYAILKNRSKEIVLGVFDNINECTTFIQNYGDLYSIKHADNNLTKEYLNVNR